MKVSGRTLFAAVGVGATALALLSPKVAHSQGAMSVQVVNTAGNPVPNQDVDNPGRHPFVGSCVSATGGDGCVINAPIGQRVVVQYANAGVFSSKGCDHFVVQQFGEGRPVSLILPCVPAGKETSVAQTPLTFFIEPGSSLFGHSFPALPSDGILQLTLTGYTIKP